MMCKFSVHSGIKSAAVSRSEVTGEWMAQASTFFHYHCCTTIMILQHLKG